MSDKKEIVRIRRGPKENAEWFIGYDRPSWKPVFAHCERSGARTLMSRESAAALLGMTGFQGAEVDVQELEE